ncbi:hypothetical protein Tco_0892028 [Tanacetum coccineum]|uniref:Uncharacterized protein n=1 Tax=Tanacetum coccineum TaxID=301880 RepID=A0ABQ5C4Z6_9ASTR
MGTILRPRILDIKLLLAWKCTDASTQLFSISGKLFGGMTQSGSGVSDASSDNGFNQSSRVLIFRRWATSVSSDSERCISSGIGLLSTTGGEAGFCLEDIEGASLMSESPLEEVEEDLGHHNVFYETYLDNLSAYFFTLLSGHSLNKKLSSLHQLPTTHVPVQNCTDLHHQVNQSVLSYAVRVHLIPVCTAARNNRHLPEPILKPVTAGQPRTCLFFVRALPACASLQETQQEYLIRQGAFHYRNTRRTADARLAALESNQQKSRQETAQKLKYELCPAPRSPMNRPHYA